MRKTTLILPLAALLALGGCTVERLSVCEYKSEGIVEPGVPETEPAGVQVAEAAFPWKPITDMLTAILPTLGQTRRKAIEEKVRYEERRSFSLLSIGKAEGIKEERKESQREGENYRFWSEEVKK